MHSVTDGYSVIDDPAECYMPRPELLAQPEGTYWHFLEASRVLRFGDGRKVVPGVTLTASDPPVLCKSGMHACRRALDALNRSPGPVVCLVTLGGQIVSGADESVARKRTVLWLYDADRLLREFACDVAESALLSERKAEREPDARSWAAIAVMRRFLRGEVTEVERYAAWSAAGTAAWDAARAVAHAVARNVSLAALSAAACAAANTNAHAVARNVVGVTALRDALRDALNERLTQMLLCARAEGLGEFAAAKCSAGKDEV